MSVASCFLCEIKECLKLGKPCQDIEKILHNEGIFKRDWLRPKMPSHKRKDGYGKWREIPFSSFKKSFIDNIADKAQMPVI